MANVTHEDGATGKTFLDGVDISAGGDGSLLASPAILVGLNGVPLFTGSGMSTSQQPQTSIRTAIISAVNNSTATGGFTSGVGSSVGVVSDGYNGGQYIEIAAVGTVAAQHVTLQIEGSDNGFTSGGVYFPGIQLISSNLGSGAVGVATPTRTSGSIDFVAGNGTVRYKYQVLDYYKSLRVTTTVNTLVTGVTVNFLGVPV
jgi:hypothetical protein